MTPTSLHKWYMNPLLTSFGKHSEYVIFYGFWFLCSTESIWSLSLEVTRSPWRPSLNEACLAWNLMTMKAASRGSACHSKEEWTPLEASTVRGGHRGVASCPHHLAVASTREKWRLTHRWDSETAKQKILLRGQKLWRISVRHISDSSCH